MSEPNDSVARILRRMAFLDMSRADLVPKCGTRDLMDQIFQRKRRIDPVTLGKIAALLNVHPDDLVSDSI